MYSYFLRKVPPSVPMGTTSQPRLHVYPQFECPPLLAYPVAGICICLCHWVCICSSPTPVAVLTGCVPLYRYDRVPVVLCSYYKCTRKRTSNKYKNYKSINIYLDSCAFYGCHMLCISLIITIVLAASASSHHHLI